MSLEKHPKDKPLPCKICPHHDGCITADSECELTDTELKELDNIECCDCKLWSKLFNRCNASGELCIRNKKHPYYGAEEAFMDNAAIDALMHSRHAEELFIANNIRTGTNGTVVVGTMPSPTPTVQWYNNPQYETFLTSLNINNTTRRS